MYKYEKVEPDDSLPMRLLDFYFEKNDYKIEKHWHNSLEILVPVIGTLQLWINGQEMTLPSGSIYIVNSRDVHDMIWLEDTPVYKGYCLQINYAFIRQCCKDIDQIYFKQPDDPKICEMIKKMIYEIIRGYEINSQYMPMYIESNLLMLLYVMCDHLAVKKELTTIAKSDRHQKRIAEMIQYMEEHYREDLSIEMLSQHFNMSSRYFSKLFKEQMGTTPKEYLTAIRLKKASQALLETDYSATDIALENGFANINSFHIAFKRKYGKTPAQYRKLMRKQ